MAAVNVTIIGTLTHQGGTTESVTIEGSASLSDLGVGGGPVLPPPGSPTFPIWGPPGSNFPGGPGYPPVAGHPLPQPPGAPTHPIVIPPAPDAPPGSPAFPIWGPPGITFPPVPGYPPVVGGGPIIGLPPIDVPPPAEGEKPPPATGGWGYWADPVNAWVYMPAPGSEPSPKA